MDASTLLSTSQDIGSSPIGKKDLVRRAICSRIITGIYRKGDNVPSCRDIAGQLLVSKNSAYEAYYDLVGLGILEARNRSGFTVALDIPGVKKQLPPDSALQDAPPKAPNHANSIVDYQQQTCAQTSPKTGRNTSFPLSITRSIPNCFPLKPGANARVWHWDEKPCRYGPAKLLTWIVRT